MHKKQIKELEIFTKDTSCTVLVLEIYQPDNSKKIKCLVAKAKGKSNYDKRHALKEKDLKRTIQRELSR